MKNDKAFDIIKYLVDNGYTYDKEHVDVTDFVKRQFANDGRAAGAVLHALYHANMIDIDGDIAGLQNRGDPVTNHKIRLRARLAAVESVNKAKDNSQIIRLTRVGIMVTLLVFVFSPLYERCSGRLLPKDKATKAPARSVEETRDTLRLTTNP